MGCMGESPKPLKVQWAQGSSELQSYPKLTGWRILAGTFKKTNFGRRKPSTLWLIYLSPPKEESQALPSPKDQGKQDSPC